MLPLPQASGIETRPQPSKPEGATYYAGRRGMAAAAAAMVVGLAAPDSRASDGVSDGGTSDIKLITFDGVDRKTFYDFIEITDVIRGGSSRAGDEKYGLSGSTKVDNGALVFAGKVGRIPRAGGEFKDGFVFTQSQKGVGQPFPDLSGCEGISLTSKTTEDYKGYGLQLFIKGDATYKARFAAPPDEFGVIKIPFTNFVDVNIPDDRNPLFALFPDFKNMETEKQASEAIAKTCEANPGDCLSQNLLDLKQIQSIAFTADGVQGKFHLEVQEAHAYGCAAPVLAPKKEESRFALSLPGFQLASIDGVSGTIFLWYLAAVTVGFVIFFVAWIRTRRAPIAPPLLG